MSDFVVIDSKSEISQAVSAGVIDGLKGLAAAAAEAEKEQKFTCVQCGDFYRVSSNNETACSFHSAQYSSWDRKYPCCGSQSPCQLKPHNPAHHSKHPYSNFFDWCYGITRYSDTTDEWTSIEDTNLETDDTQTASIAQLLRFQSRGARCADPTMVIKVGRVWHTQPYFFQTFTATQLAGISKEVAASGETLIFRTSSSDTEFALAEWVVANGKINGVRLSVKAATSTLPFTHICPIDITTVSKSGDINVVSEGGFRSYKPAEPYTLPETVRIGPVLSDQPLRKVRTDFKTKTSAALPVLLKVTSDPPLKANPGGVSASVDYLVGTVSIFNKALATSGQSIAIDSISAEFRLLGDSEYLPVKSLEIVGRNTDFPVTIEPRETYALEFLVAVPRSAEDKQLDARWYGRSFISRHRPLRLKLTVKDIEDEEASIVLEHVYNPRSFDVPKPEEDLAFFFFDDSDYAERRSVRVTKAESDDEVLRIQGTAVEGKALQKLVHQARTTGETEFLVSESDLDTWSRAAYALVDKSCNHVYAFKILLKSKKFATLGYVACPSYGNVIDEARPISYAEEKVTLPQLEAFTPPKVLKDDDLDDVINVPPTSTGPPAATTVATSASSIPGDLAGRLASIDSSLSRIALSLEKLVDVLGKK